MSFVVGKRMVVCIWVIFSQLFISDNVRILIPWTGFGFIRLLYISHASIEVILFIFSFFRGYHFYKPGYQKDSQTPNMFHINIFSMNEYCREWPDNISVIYKWQSLKLTRKTPTASTYKSVIICATSTMFKCIGLPKPNLNSEYSQRLSTLLCRNVWCVLVYMPAHNSFFTYIINI